MVGSSFLLYQVVIDINALTSEIVSCLFHEIYSENKAIYPLSLDSHKNTEIILPNPWCQKSTIILPTSKDDTHNSGTTWMEPK